MFSFLFASDDAARCAPVSPLSSSASLRASATPPAAALSDTAASLVGFRVLLFASLRDAARSDSIVIHFPLDKAATVCVSQLLRACEEQFPALAPCLPYVRVAINFEYSNADDVVAPNDEIAFLPPVSGGSADDSLAEKARPLVAIAHEPIDTNAVARSAEACLGGGAGAIVTFEGVVRDNAAGHQVDFLEYFAYEAMALRTLQQVSEEVRARWDLPCALVHRLGRLEIGEASIVIAVASPHRAAAFEACRYAIDRIKEIVPIWKKETARDGSWWVEDPLHSASA